MTLMITEFAGLHILHWVISGLIPILLAGLTVGCLAVNSRLRRRAIWLVNRLIEQVNGLEGRTIENLPAVDAIFKHSRAAAFSRAFSRMQQECHELYEDRWLPDPKKILRQDILLTSSQQASISLRPAAGLLAVAILAALVSLLVQNPIPPQNESLKVGLILLPFLTGLAGAILAAASAQRTGRLLHLRLQDLHHSLETRLPVFSDQAGLAMLIDNFLVYDRQMKDSLHDFTATASRLAESEMADGIRRSVEQVLQESVAPSIQQSAATLNSLAVELANRQDRGMQDLAVRFATALSEELASHLHPVNKEIAQMGTLMADVKNYIEYAMRALETVRLQSEGLLGDTRQAVLQMAESRARMTDDFSRVGEQLQSLTASTSQMASLYQGNEHNLAQNLQVFGHQMDQFSQRLGSLVHEAIQSMQDTRVLADGQQASAEQHLAAMQEQISQLHAQLGSDIQTLLEQVRRETSTVAERTGSFGQQLGILNSTLGRSMDDFTRASAQYVQNALASFDSGLAELTDRLAHTAAEIRDAVDALPAALRQGPGARYDG